MIIQISFHQKNLLFHYYTSRLLRIIIKKKKLKVNQIVRLLLSHIERDIRSIPQLNVYNFNDGRAFGRVHPLAWIISRAE